jgi:hypothetical protein
VPRRFWFDGNESNVRISEQKQLIVGYRRCRPLSSSGGSQDRGIDNPRWFGAAFLHR